MVCHDPSYRMFAHANVHNIGVALGNGHRTHRAGFKIAIRNIEPGNAHILCFPQSAAGGAHIIGTDIAHNAGGSHRSSTAEGTDTAPFYRFENSV